MKKTLLLLLLFTFLPFYSQIADLESNPNLFTNTESETPLSFTATTTVINYTGCNYFGTITINAIGGEAPYSYSSDGINYVSNNVFSDLRPNTYTIYVKDSNGSISIQEVQLKGLKDMLYYPILSVTNVSCNGGSDGSVILDTTKYSGEYIYEINGGIPQIGNIITGLSAGTYSIGVRNTDAGCGIELRITITEPAAILNLTTAISNVSCSGNKDGSISATVTGGKAPYFYSLDGKTYVESNTFYTLYAGTHSITVKDSNADCGTITNIIITEPNPIAATVSVEDQNITINATGGTGSYKYSIHPNTQSYLPEDNIYYNLYPGDNYTITVKDENDCIFEISKIVINPSTPLINGKKAITIDFTLGQTLGDIIVDGENIKWYSNPNSSTGKTSKSSETSLPSTTILVDGVSYYASQTINGIESKERLAVTAKLSTSLSTEDFVLPNFRFYPNPVQHTLTIDNTSTIDEIEILSVSGKSILTKKINNTRSEIDLSNVSTGFYFLKVRSEGQVKMIKIVKK